MTKDIGHDDTETGEYSNILNVYIARSPGQSLGISIVGGNEEALSKGIIGIFVRTIVEDSPAGCENGLKVNDRILEVRNLCFLKKPQVFLLFIFGQVSILDLHRSTNFAPMHFALTNIRTYELKKYFQYIKRAAISCFNASLSDVPNKAFFNSMDAWWGIFPIGPLPLPHH